MIVNNFYPDVVVLDILTSKKILIPNAVKENNAIINPNIVIKIIAVFEGLSSEEFFFKLSYVL